MPDGSAVRQLEEAPYEEMSPTLLSQQPPSAPEVEGLYTKDWGQIYAHLEARLGALRSWRWSWWVHWSVLAEFFLPRRWMWLVTANRMWKGRPINDQIVDTNPLQDVRTCAAGVWNGLMNPARPWFKFGIATPGQEPDSDAKLWLEGAEQRCYQVFAQSNTYTQMAQGFQDVTVFGTAPIIVYEDAEDVIRLYGPACGEYYLGVGARLAVDTLYREFVLTTLQLVDQFQVENCPPEIQKMWSEHGANLEQEWVVCHAIEPNFPLQSRRKGSGKVWVVPSVFAWREVYWLRGNKSARPLSKRGFYSKPFFAMRWYTNSNEPYGRSPCMDALGDAKQIQQETRRKAEFIEKGIRPPMGADPELKNEPASIIPGMITYMNTAGQKKGFWPLFEVQAQWLQHLVVDIKDVTQRIKTCLFVDLFMAITQMQGVQPRNELELTKRDLERLQVLGPFITQFETECADQLLSRTMEILERKRLLPPRPPSLRGVSIKIVYQSMMRLAQKSAEAVSLKDFAQTAGATSAAAKAAQIPDPARTVDWDKFLRRYGAATNVSEDLFFSKDEIAQHDQARDQAVQQATQQAQAPGEAMATVKAAKTLADTPLNNGSALDAMIGPAAYPGG